MKIAILNIYNGLVERGSEVFVDEIAKRLGRENNVVVFQCGPRKNPNYRICQIKDVPFAPHQERAGLINKLYDLWVLLFTIKTIPFLWREKFDWIVPVNGRFQVLFCRLVRKIRGGKLLITGHAGVGIEDWINLKIGKPDVFVALTPKAYTWAKSLTDNKVVYIPNGVNINEFKVIPQKIKLPFTKPIVMCVGALLSYKRIGLLIEAVSLLPRVNLLVIGDGILRSEIERKGQEKLGKRFLLIKHVNHEEIAGYYRSCDVFSLPSKPSEAFGLVYLEALAANLPVVAPDDENRRYIIGNGGIYCNVENTFDYAEKLEKALITKWGNRPIRQAKKFSWEETSKKYETAFKDL